MFNEPKPTRCVDPVMKYCQGCQYGCIEYPSWVETYEDLDGCPFETHCIYGFDKGRPEDEPTEEELKEFEEWWKRIRSDVNGENINGKN